MSINFFETACQTHSNNRTFGLCDDPPPVERPAYIDEANGENWIAVVDNFYEEYVTFTAIDHCIVFPLKPDGKSHKRCDGVLTYTNTVAFVELKQRDEDGAVWVKDAEKQLRVSIEKFEDTKAADQFATKRAYIVNSERPRFRDSQVVRMERFAEETTYVLRIEARIAIY
jgi:hypothetical protein